MTAETETSLFRKVLNATVLSPYGNYIDGHVDPPKGKIMKETATRAVVTPYGNYVDGIIRL